MANDDQGRGEQGRRGDQAAATPRGAPKTFGGKPPPVDWRKWIKPGAWGLLALYALAFVLLNGEQHDVHFLFFTAETNTIWLILFAMALGAGLSEGVRMWRRRVAYRGAPDSDSGRDA